jgi:hypothetical protein
MEVMAVDRMLRAEMRESEKVNSWPYPLRYFWTQLWGYCDDWGRGRRDPRLVKSGVMPLDDEATYEVVDRWMTGLESAGVIQCYTVDGKVYFECVNWDESQDPPYRRKTAVPDPQGNIPAPRKSSGKFQKVSAEREGEREEEEKGKGKGADAPPSPFCPRHPQGTDDPCKGCGNARRLRADWDAAEKAKPSQSHRRPRKGDGHDCSADGNGWCSMCGEKAA